MSAEELKEQVDSAVEQAIVGDADLDEIEHTLKQAQERLEAVRAYQEGDA